MTTCVFYDLDTIDRAKVAEVVSEVGPGAVHIRRADAGWPEGVEVDTAMIATARDYRFGDGLTERLDRGIAAMGPDAWRARGVDLLDAVRFEWFFAVRSQAHRIWALDEITRRYRPRQLLWVAPTQPAFRAALLGMSRHARLLPESPRPPSLHGVAAGARAAFLSAAVRASEATRARIRPRTPLQASGRPLVLFVENYADTVAGIVVPVLERLRARSEVDTGLLAMRRQALATGTGEIPGVRLLSREVPARAFAEAARAELLAWRVAGEVARVVAKDTSTWGVAADLWQPALRSLSGGLFREAAYAAVLLYHALETLRPSVLASTSHFGSFARIASQLGHQRGVPSCLVQHGLMYLDTFQRHACFDRLLVWGQRDRRSWVETGSPDAAITVTGCPRFDKWPAPVSRPCADPFTIVFFPSRTDGSFVSSAVAQEMVDRVLGAFARLKGARLTIKVHPGDKGELYAALRLPPGASVVAQGNPLGFMGDADVVIASTSTAALEACGMDRALVLLEPPQGMAVLPGYREHGAALFPATRDELLECLMSIRTVPEARENLRAGRQALLADSCDGLRPGAADRIAEALAREALPGGSANDQGDRIPVRMTQAQGKR
jgi:hypothetical protein